jgi:hypothetical protein
MLARAARLLPGSGLMVLLVLGPLCAAGQPPLPSSATEGQKAQPKGKKVWTEDDLVGLRKPWDLHQIDREKKAEEERAAKERELAPQHDASLPTREPASRGTSTEAKPEIPESVPAVEKQIADVAGGVENLEQQLRGLEDIELNGREDERANIGGKREEINRELEKARTELRLLRSRLESLKPSSAKNPPN